VAVAAVAVAVIVAAAEAVAAGALAILAAAVVAAETANAETAAATKPRSTAKNSRKGVPQGRPSFFAVWNDQLSGESGTCPRLRNDQTAMAKRPPAAKNGEASGMAVIVKVCVV